MSERISLEDLRPADGATHKIKRVGRGRSSGHGKTSARGNNGGYRLAREPKDYVVGEILRATEGDLTPLYCLTEEGDCERRECCKTHHFWKGLDDVINEYVDSKTLADLIK